MKIDSVGAIRLLSCDKVDLIQRNSFVVMGIEIGEGRRGHYVILNRFGGAPTFEDHSERNLWFFRLLN